MDVRVKKLADILVNYSVKVQPGDWVIVRGGALALPLFREVVEKVVKAGGHPSLIVEDESLLETVMRFANEDQLRWTSPLSKLMCEKADAFINLRAPHNTRAFSASPQKNKRCRRLRERSWLRHSLHAPKLKICAGC